MPVYFHGGKAGLQVGDRLEPSAPHVVDNCPVCQARAAGRVCTVGEYLRWALVQAPSSRRDQLIRWLQAQPFDAPVDPPSAKRAVYLTTDLDYATWYAARSQGDLYQVTPVAPLVPSPEDHFPSWTTAEARVLRVVRRGVRLDRHDRRRIMRRWEKADRRVDRARARAIVEAQHA